MEKMAIDKLMMFLPIILVAVIALIMIIKFIKKKYNPQTDFINIKELKAYYAQSLKLIWNNKIILYIPMIMISITILLGLIGQIQFYKSLLEDNHNLNPINLFNFELSWVITSALSSLGYGIVHAFTSSHLLTLLSVLLIFIYPKFLKQLRDKTSGQRFPQLRLFKKVMIMNVFIVIFQILFFTLLLKQYLNLEDGIFSRFIPVALDAMMKFFIFSNYSFVIVIFLQIILDKLNDIKRDKAGYLEVGINKFPIMLSFNILLLLVIPFLISLSNVFFNSSRTVNGILDYLTQFIYVLFLTVPFLIMNRKLQFSEVLEKSLTLFFRNFRVPMFILGGLIGGAALYVITSFLADLWLSLFLNRYMDSFLSIFSVVYSMIFIVAFFLFLKGELGKE